MTVAGSNFTGNTLSGMTAFSAAAEVGSSRFAGSPTGIEAAESRLTLRGSDVDRNRTGLLCSRSVCDVRGTTVHRSGTGVQTVQGRLVLRSDEVRGNDVGVAVNATGGAGPDEVALNHISGNGTGVLVGSLADVSVQRNRIDGNGVGIATAPGTTGYRLTAERNTLDRNHDGMLLDAGLARLGRDVVRDSTDWGIRAPGAVDLGGNVGTGNGHVPQCLGVTCS
ncbi:hypothetical protein GCM10025868_16600 [Angustibacter aerolatus]|uniref:Periplasmic copper-binding protein NosD beta helix domain-containing protein n=1 Tax=Angustibacter aerolatus TaxID=1162965 RepID=A0ABQ6JHV1_9ACTN|nr:NosD domain-containing protein [Angustibacter aerolatus]GMA86410.1 hypothetical protein GCM10025868_16600 [Angustibacter aerolatus]